MTPSNRFATLVVAALVLAACSSETPVAPSESVEGGPASLAIQAAPELVMEGEIIVGMRDGADVSAVAREHGLDLGYAGYRNAFFVLRGPAGNEHAQAAGLRSGARVAYAEPNYLRQPTAIRPELWAFF